MISGRITSKVLVCHSGRQHSHQLAMALADRGMLAKYVTGIPTHRNAGGWLGSRLLRGTADAYAISIDPALVQHVFIAPVVRAAARTLGAKSDAIGHLADGWFDRCVCGLLDRLKPDVVVAYENSALFTFRRAKRLGIKTVLDAASVHHHWGDRYFSADEGAWFHRKINARKEQEIGLADSVITVSELARASYVEGGVPPERVHSIPVGVDVNRFHLRKCANMADQNCRFVYVGSSTRRKGLAVLRDATSRLHAGNELFTVTQIGGTKTLVKPQSSDQVVQKNWLSHHHLPAELASHDVLVLPSLFDSFGMVVAEAMACGLPVIVTENVGAKEMVSPGVNGLIVPVGNAEALANAMRWFIQHRECWPRMSWAARESAERYDWSVYHRRVTEFLGSL